MQRTISASAVKMIEEDPHAVIVGSAALAQSRSERIFWGSTHRRTRLACLDYDMNIYSYLTNPDICESRMRGLGLEAGAAP